MSWSTQSAMAAMVWTTRTTRSRAATLRCGTARRQGLWQGGVGRIPANQITPFNFFIQIISLQNCFIFNWNTSNLWRVLFYKIIDLFVSTVLSNPCVSCIPIKVKEQSCTLNSSHCAFEFIANAFFNTKRKMLTICSFNIIFLKSPIECTLA